MVERSLNDLEFGCFEFDPNYVTNPITVGNRLVVKNIVRDFFLNLNHTFLIILFSCLKKRYITQQLILLVACLLDDAIILLNIKAPL